MNICPVTCDINVVLTLSLSPPPKMCMNIPLPSSVLGNQPSPKLLCVSTLGNCYCLQKKMECFVNTKFAR